MIQEGAAQRLLGAQGVLLDGLTALRNVERLVSSSRVGPRSLLSVLPDALSACRSLTTNATTYRELALEIAGSSKHVDAYTQLERFIVRELGLIAESVEQVGQSLTAGKRLAFETKFSRHTRHLSAALSVLDLLSHALVARQTEIDMTELLRQSRQAGGARAQNGRHSFSQAGVVDIEVSLPERPLLVHANAAVAIGLVSVGAGFLARSGSGGWLLSAYVVDGKVRLELGKNSRAHRDPSGHVAIWAVPWIKATSRALELAAELAGGELINTPESGALQIEWPLVVRAESSREAVLDKDARAG